MKLRVDHRIIILPHNGRLIDVYLDAPGPLSERKQLIADLREWADGLEREVEAREANIALQHYGTFYGA
jgi:hypothetical protein